MSGRFGSICLTASRTAPAALAGRPAVRTSNTGLPTRVCWYGTYIVGGAASRTLSYLDVPQHADDLEIAARFDARAKATADRILVGKVLARRRFVDDDHLLAARVVAIGETAPAEHGDLHEVEEIRRDDQAVDVVVPVPDGEVVDASLDVDAGRVHAAGQQGRRRHRDAANARHRRDTVEHVAVERGHALLVVPVQGRVHTEQEEVLRIESDLHVPQVLERSQKKAGADEQHQRDGDLHDEQ